MGKKVLLPVTSCDTKDLYHNVHIVKLYSERYMVFRLFRCLNLLKQEQIFNYFHKHKTLSISSSTKIPLSRKQQSLHSAFEVLESVLCSVSAAKC